MAIGSEAIKRAIKVLILLPSSRIWPSVMPIFPDAPRRRLRDSSFYLYRIKGPSNNKRRWQAASTFRAFNWTKEEEGWWGVLTFSSSHCQRSLLWACCVVKTTQAHWGENSNHRSGTCERPKTWPTVKFPYLVSLRSPLMAEFDWLVLLPFVVSLFLLFTCGQRAIISHFVSQRLGLLWSCCFSEGENTPQTDRRQSTLHPQDSG